MEHKERKWNRQRRERRERNSFFDKTESSQTFGTKEQQPDNDSEKSFLERSKPENCIRPGYISTIAKRYLTAK